MRSLVQIIVVMLLTASSAKGEALFPSQIEAFDKNFKKLGEHHYVYRLFFDLYEVALFAEPGATAEDVLQARSAFCLQFRYLREIEKSIILKSADEMLKRNLSAEERKAIDERVSKINEAYTGVTKGDRSSLTYIPGKGTTLMINDEPAVTIEGQDFAALYFQIWLGEQPISKSLKKDLLGKAE